MVSNGLSVRRTYFNESVFALSLLENVEVFEYKGTTNNTHILFSYVAAHVLCIYPILFKCGVLYRLFLYRSFHNLLTNK